MSNEQQEAAKKAELEAKAKAEQDAADAKAEKADRAEKARLVEEAKTLVKMTKQGETLAVHPTCVSAHIAAGWKVAA